MSSSGVMFFVTCNPTSWEMLVYTGVTSMVANMVVGKNLLMEHSFCRKSVLSFKKLEAPMAHGNRIEST